MTNRERVLALVRFEPGGLTDSEILQRTCIDPHRQVNQICRKLAQAGLIQRRSGREGRLINLPAGFLEGSSHPNRRRTLGTTSEKCSLRRVHAGDAAEMPRLSISKTLFVVPCSGAKQEREVRVDDSGTSVLDSLPRLLAAELSAWRAKMRRKRRLTSPRVCRRPSDRPVIFIGRPVTHLPYSLGRERTSSSSRVDMALSYVSSRLAATTRCSVIQCGRPVWSRDVSVLTRTRSAPQLSSVCSPQLPNMPAHSARPSGLTASIRFFMSGQSGGPARSSRRLVQKEKH